MSPPEILSVEVLPVVRSAIVAGGGAEIAAQPVLAPLPMPAPRLPIRIRPATPADIPFMDALQKRHAKQVGWMPTAQFEGKIALGHVLVAEEEGGGQMAEEEGRGQMAEGRPGEAGPALSNSNARPSATRPRPPAPCPLPSAIRPLPSAIGPPPSPIGYIIGNDRYFKREDVGIIYQVCVAPGARRGLVGAALVKAMFDRAAYGCRLFCCWCAQDIEANRFWESLGFVPLAFRAGSRGKKRVHIFWQKRIRPDDDAPWWFPSQTGGGSIREDRIVLPIPPGTHWSQAVPLVLPGEPSTPALPESAAQAVGRIDAARARRSRPAVEKRAGEEPGTLGGLWFVPPPAEPAKPAREGRQSRKRPPAKNDPRLVAAARELRDRWLERVNAGESPALPQGKYDLLRGESVEAPMPLPQALPALAA